MQTCIMQTCIMHGQMPLQLLHCFLQQIYQVGHHLQAYVERLPIASVCGASLSLPGMLLLGGLLFTG